MKEICLRISDPVARYLEATHGNLTELSQTLLEDAFRSILELEVLENPEEISQLIEILKEKP